MLDLRLLSRSAMLQALMAIFLIGCSGEKSVEARVISGPDWKITTSPANDTITFEGNITPESADAFVKINNPSVRSVRIWSGGGDIASAIRIGNSTALPTIMLEIIGPCLSACAHFVAALSTNVKFAGNAILGFHGTATSREISLRESGEKAAASSYSELAALEQKTYTFSKLDKRLLLLPSEKVEPLCYFFGPEPSGRIVPHFRNRYTFFVPTSATLKTFGVKWAASLPPMSIGLLEQAALLIPAIKSYTFRIEKGMETDISSKSAELETC